VELVRKISGGVKRLEALVSQVLHFAREIRATLAPTDLSAVVAQAVELSAQQRIDAHVECHIIGPATMTVTIDSMLIGQCLLNLLLNAIEAMASEEADKQRILTIRFNAPPRESDAKQFHLTVTDSGAGIAPSVLDRIFNPFFTTKDTGTGLGLAIVHRVIEAHDGTIIACNVENNGVVSGAKFEIRI
jgi:signal transduction histidine kinase